MRRIGISGTALGLVLLAAGAGLVADPAGGGDRDDRGGREEQYRARPGVSIRLGCAEANGIPQDGHCSQTGGGNCLVRQPAPDTLVISMTARAMAHAKGLAPSSAGFHLDLSQEFTVVFESPDVSQATLQVQGYATGLLRSPCKGSAGLAKACAAVVPAGPVGAELASFCLPTRAVGPGENASVYLRSDRLCVAVVPGCCTLRQSFAIEASEPAGSLPGRGALADFAPGEDETVSFGRQHNPFKGVSKKDFGFHVIVKVEPVPQPAGGQRGLPSGSDRPSP